MVAGYGASVDSELRCTNSRTWVTAVALKGAHRGETQGQAKDRDRKSPEKSRLDGPGFKQKASV